ncbi:tetrahydrofolate synthase [Basidiobolus ranarum]|uniref:Tetrahydrofolate synthase n=1 Tax=Basidiobolus ranarum TaxID=34480 RepID=A0ABR2W315_9FUNG
MLRLIYRTKSRALLPITLGGLPTRYPTYRLLSSHSSFRSHNMPAQLIDGKSIAQSIRTKLKEETAELKQKYSTFKPHLAIVQVGEREDSSLYVRQKARCAKEIDFEFTDCKLPDTVTQHELLEVVNELNSNPAIHGILVQLPLPKGINEIEITEAISPEKDVDGFHPYNIGRLSKRSCDPMFLPCTPFGILELLTRSKVDISGKKAVVIGRSDIVGTPIFNILTNNNATAVLCHSKTQNLPEIVKSADIVVVAIGQPDFVKGDWIKPGALLLT